MILIAAIQTDRYIQSPTLTHRYRTRNVVYTLDGTAQEDRLGGAKKMLTLPFALLPGEVWRTLRTALTASTVPVSGSVGSDDVSGNYRLAGNDIPTPILYVDNGEYICQPFTVTLEEI